ncbi:uncharacterized protein LOC130731753 [Lotus japonicus]|uniref:uncharacterized protein LOC130731753 n=1 Tax=Lotus japonicus TaxID=34305 RepID=UPI002583D4D9|nr:uncharacterized protein LOC130731753 [Lotus japonicus]
MPMNRGQGKPKRWYQLCFAPTSDSSDDSDTESVVLPPNSTITSTWQEISPPESTPPPSPPLPLPPPPPPPPNFELLLPPPPPPQLNFEQPLRMAGAQLRLFYPSPNLELPPPPSRPSPGAWDIAFDIESLSSISPSPSRQRFEVQDSVMVQDSVINAIHKVRISELHRRGEMSHCPICMEEVKVGDQACLLPCTHFYCSECILQRLRLSNNKTCPVCRLQLEGWEDHGNSHSIDETASAWDFFGHQNLPPPSPPLVIGVDQDWDYFLYSSPDSSVTENNSAGRNSDEADHYDSACEELGDNSLDLGPENSSPPPPPPVIPRHASSFSWENFYPSSPESDTAAT